MKPTRLLVLSGSSRHGSLNRRLADAAAAIARSAGAEAVPLDLRELALPLYDGGTEATSGVPAGATQLRDAVANCEALLIASPEYNGFPPPLLINALDWLSRVQPAAGSVGGLQATTDKPVALLAASPGPLGGLRAMNTLRLFLQMNFAMIVVPQQFALGRAGEAFDEAGGLKDAKAAQSVRAAVDAALRLAAARSA